MRYGVVTAVAVVMTSLISPATAVAGADLSLTLEAWKGASLKRETPHEGPLRVTPDPELGYTDGTNYVTFWFNIHNNGPDAAWATLDPDIFPLKGDGRYTYWTAPVAITGEGWQGGMSDCDHSSPNFTCRVRIGAGKAYWVKITVRGNAPGRVTVSGELTSSVHDPVMANNTVVDRRAVVCSINGEPGDVDDVLRGTSRVDSICGGRGDDVITSVGRGDKIFGGPGNDFIKTSAASEDLVGGTGVDTVSYAAAPRAVRVSLADGGARGWGWDVVLQIENVIGSRYGDYLEGTSGVNAIYGRGGGDEILGRGGRDVLDGAGGRDEFISRDDVRDIVRGGSAADAAYRDRMDVVRSSSSAPNPLFADRTVRPPSPG